MTPGSKEREKSEDNLKAKSPSLLTLLAPSILSICLSIICLCGLTWAWFADSVSNSLGVIKTGQVRLEVSYAEVQQERSLQKTGSIEETESFIAIPGEETFQLPIVGNAVYRVRVTNSGTVNGYIVISNSVNDEKYVAKIETNRGGQDKSIEFGIVCKTEEPCDIQIQGYWGTWETRADYETYILLEDVSGNDIDLVSAYDVSGSDVVIIEASEQSALAAGALEDMDVSKDQIADVSAGDVSGNEAISFGYPVIIIE